MKRILFLVLPVAVLSACGTPADTVLFVTNTSFGINAESKPATASIAYDRVEGYIGPRATNGGMPPVVASLQTSGDVFDPKIRQVYATGAAASLAANPASGAAGPSDLVGSDGKIAFFGTATTIGLKAGFDTSGAPDSFVLGFKRKELSVIPLGSDGTKAVYPSVLASIDTTVGTTSLKDTGLTISQYFATGKPAETLASNNPTVQQSFSTITTNAVLSTLTTQQQADAQKNASAAQATQNTNVEKVMGAVAPGGALDTTKLSALISRANTIKPGSVNVALAKVTTADELRTDIEYSLPMTNSLATAVDNP